MSKLDEARQSLADLAEEIRGLAERDDLSPEEETRFDAAEGEFVAAKEAAEKLEARMKLVEDAAKVPEFRSSGDGASKSREELDVHVRTKSDPYDLSEIRMFGQSEKAIREELRSRAHDAIEQAPEYVSDAARQDAARLVDSQDTTHARMFAEHMLSHGSPEYTDAFFQYLRGGINAVENRAALSTTAANGGYLIPFFLDPTIILTNAGVVNPFRQIAAQVTIPTNVWHGVSSAGVTAEWTAEATEVTDASPTFAQPTITPIRADAYVQASFEVTQDSNIANQIGMLFADAKGRLEGAAFATGSGSTQPLGIVTRMQQVTASRVAANTNGVFQSGDVFALVNSLSARWQNNCSWVGHWFTANLIRQQVVVNNPSAVAGGNWVDYGPGIPSTLLGRPFHLSSAMTNAGGTTGLSSATASSDDILVLGDFSQFLIVDRMGMEIVNNPLVIGTNRRPTGEVGWACFWRVGSGVLVDDAFRMLRV